MICLCLGFMVATGFALYTNHIWEDYYITFRSSKHLATGHGLVFNVGDRLHTFTSPLGVLLPALASWVTGTTADTAALWLFRLMSALAFGGAAWMMARLADRKVWGTGLLGLLLAGFLLDAKSVDFSINGMETGLLLFFLAYQFYALFKGEGRQWLHLGLAWAGMMWTRPDGFLYIGLLALAVWMFNRPESTGMNRRQLAGLFFKAGLLCTLLYLPWFAATWLYYGTPVPHTVTAKAAVANPPAGGLAMVKALGEFPLRAWSNRTVFDDVFTASYSATGWPGWLTWFSRLLALGGSLLWILPRIRIETKAASLAGFGLLFYLNTFTSFAYPWYLPGPAWLLWMAWGFALYQWVSWLNAKSWHGLRWVLFAGLLGIVGVRGWLFYEVAKGVRQEQRVINDGLRQPMGEWLRDNSKAGDTVFLESLGYVGYFSNLKTYDYPGMSSREMPELIRSFTSDWGGLIDYFCPDWVILRPAELDFVERSVPLLLTQRYVEVKRFKVPADIIDRSLSVMPFADFDSEFILYRRKVPKTRGLDVSNYSRLDDALVLDRNLSSEMGFGVQATSLVSFKVPKGATSVEGYFRVDRFKGVGSRQPEGVGFQVYWRSENTGRILFSTYLNPWTNPGDRLGGGYQVSLPVSEADAEIFLIAAHNHATEGGWVEWSLPRFSDVNGH